jgi:hypothetical protein
MVNILLVAIRDSITGEYRVPQKRISRYNFASMNGITRDLLASAFHMPMMMAMMYMRAGKRVATTG